ncbi:MAG: hypothetical protein M1294_03110 [Firmicutes bacterium]|uniref:Uncharacterized protein n=1 Tax=Sulfobacillus benefaciens TaxID=453960 RepID=A0A2T2XB92_9FIRM|nr:hypothetical protein [Bacillota bacterium]MCL5012409.1 hypothetical protein [Bacillota bacterium]PSR31793.1 MAG: hypothetical protein C7B43_00805 [Sulfobacillus benefaciens]
MCTNWSKALVMLGVMTSLLNHWFILIALYPLAASLLTRLLHQDVWPAKTTCPLPPNPPVNIHEKRVGRTK